MADPNALTTRLSAGILHFDVSLGCTAEVLIGSLADLEGDVSVIKQGLKACGILGIAPFLRNESSRSVAGISIDFVLDSGMSLKAISKAKNTILPNKSFSKRRPFWVRTSLKKEEPYQGLSSENRAKSSEVPLHGNTLFGSWIRGEPATLAEMKNLIDSSSLTPIPLSLARKTITLLTTSLSQALGREGSEAPIKGKEGALILCEVIAFSQLMAALDPLFVTATRVAMSNSSDSSLAPDEIDQHQPSWILALAQGIPTIDRDWPSPYCDCVGLALLQSVVSRFGARGESILLRHGAGLSSMIAEPFIMAKALWCTPPHIDSRTALEAGKLPTHLPLLEICTILGQGIEIPELLRRLSGLGMKSIVTWQVYEAASYPRLMLRGLMPYQEASKAIEALLITGEATEVTTNLVESQSIQRRLVSVPYGKGQAMQACRVSEWIWSGKVLRADPESSDLSLLAKTTGLAQEVVRADVLAAWRKLQQQR